MQETILKDNNKDNNSASPSCIRQDKITVVIERFLNFFLSHYDLLQDIEYSSLGYTVGLCHLSILYIVVFIC